MTGHLPPLDKDLQSIVDRIAAAGAPRGFDGPIEEARARLSRAIRASREGAVLPEVATADDRDLHCDGRSIPARIYRPHQEGELPVVVFFHGGGFAVGGIDEFDESARRLCRDLDAVVILVGYRLAPEHPFPAALDDATAATLWAVDNAADLGSRPDKITVAGESAGANLAASVALILRDRGIRLAAQLLIVPSVDYAREIPEGIVYPMLTAADLAVSKGYLFGDAPVDFAAFPPSPLYAADHGNLPPTVLAVAGHDPLRREGLAYAEKLSAAGVRTELLDFPTMYHMFFGVTRASAGAEQAVAAFCKASRELLWEDGQ